MSLMIMIGVRCQIRGESARTCEKDFDLESCANMRKYSVNPYR